MDPQSGRLARDRWMPEPVEISQGPLYIHIASSPNLRTTKSVTSGEVCVLPNQQSTMTTDCSPLILYILPTMDRKQRPNMQTQIRLTVSLSLPTLYYCSWQQQYLVRNLLRHIFCKVNSGVPASDCCLPVYGRSSVYPLHSSNRPPPDQYPHPCTNINVSSKERSYSGSLIILSPHEPIINHIARGCAYVRIHASLCTRSLV